MLRFRHRCLPLLLAGVALGLSAGSPAAQAKDPAPSVDKLNKKIDNITLRDTAGKAVSLYDLKDRKAVVVVFLSFECPVSTSYSAQLAELAKTYADRKVAFLGIDSIDEGGQAAITKQAAEYKIPFSVLADDHFKAADAFKADHVPSAFVLDHNFVLRYRGRIDNGYRARLKKNNETTRNDLREALDDVLAGKPVREPATAVVGCPIQRSSRAARTGRVTYYRDVLPILQKNCQECHRPGEVGPFALMTYKQAVRWAGDIKEYTQDRRMPPWKPVEGVAFHDQRRLADRDIRTLAAWVDGGTPEGDAHDAPPPREFTRGWQLGKPDLVLTLPAEMTIGPSGPDLFRCFVLPTNLTEDKYVVAVDVRPGNKRIVHHTLNFIDTSGKGRELEQKAQAKEKDAKNLRDHGPGYSSKMGIGFRPQSGMSGWAPGNRARVLPAEAGFHLPKGADVVLQIHYHRNGRTEKDRTSIGLYFARKPVTHPWKGLVARGNFLAIPPNNPHFQVKGGLEVLQECDLHSVMPHMHMLGREIKVTITPPGGKPYTLLAIKDWDYNWQETYFLEKPIHLTKGTRIDTLAAFDNSDKNPMNPNSPPRWVIFGEQTTDEMCFVFFGATSETPGRIRFQMDGRRRPGAARRSGARD